MRWPYDSSYRETAEPPPFPQLTMALDRQVTWTREFADAGDLGAALEALLDANAITGELELPAPA